MTHKKKYPVYLDGYSTALFVYMLLFLIPVFTLTGCGGKTILSEDAVKTRNIHDYVFKIKELYEEKDERLTAMFTKEYFPNEFNDAILRDFSRFDNISLKLIIDRIQINKDTADVTIHWNGTWKDKKTDNKTANEKTLIEGGSMVLLIQYEDSIKITGIKGDSPFGISKHSEQ